MSQIKHHHWHNRDNHKTCQVCALAVERIPGGYTWSLPSNRTATINGEPRHTGTARVLADLPQHHQLTTNTDQRATGRDRGRAREADR